MSVWRIGTTLIAAEQTERRARLCERGPNYCDTIIRRLQKLTGKHALHAPSGRRFDTLEANVSDTDLKLTRKIQ